MRFHPPVVPNPCRKWWYLMLMVSSSSLLVGASVKLLSRGVAASELRVGGIQRPFRRWRVTFTLPFSLPHLFAWCRWNVSGRLLFIWMGRRASDRGNGNQLLSMKRLKLLFHLRQHGGQEYLQIWCIRVPASHAGSSGALPEALFSVFSWPAPAPSIVSRWYGMLHYWAVRYQSVGRPIWPQVWSSWQLKSTLHCLLHHTSTSNAFFPDIPFLYSCHCITDPSSRILKREVQKQSAWE